MELIRGAITVSKLGGSNTWRTQVQEVTLEAHDERGSTSLQGGAYTYDIGPIPDPLLHIIVKSSICSQRGPGAKLLVGGVKPP